MKTQVYNVFIALSLTLAALTGCNNDNETTTNEETQFLTKIAGTWKLTDARVDGLLITSAFDELELTFDGKNYEVTNAVPPIWPNSGTYTLQQVQGAQPYALVRNDEVVIAVAELTAATLILKFQYASTDNGRLQSLSGRYEFRFTKS